MRVVLAFLVQYEVRDGVHIYRGRDFIVPTAMGDDCVEDRRVCVERYLERYGLKVEVDGRDAGEFEYCSMLFGRGTPFPISWPRTLFRYVSANDTVHFAELAFDLRHHPRCDEFLAWCAEHVRGTAVAPEKDLDSSDCEVAWPEAF